MEMVRVVNFTPRPLRVVPPSPSELKAEWRSWLVRNRSFGEDKSHLFLATNPDSKVVQPVTYLPFWYNNVKWNAIVMIVVKAVSGHPFMQ